MEFSFRFEPNYINKMVKKFLAPEKICDENGREKVTTYSYYLPDTLNPSELIKRKGKGRPFVFKREKFVVE